MLRERKKKL